MGTAETPRARSGDAVDRRPRVLRVLRSQLALVGLGRRRELLAVSVFMGVVVAWMLTAARAPGPDVRSALGTAVVLGYLWPVSVWEGEPPSRRLYHRLLPVGERLHNLLRIGAGGTWIVASLAAGTLIGMGAAGLLGHASAGFAPAAALEAVGGVLVMYGLGSVAAVATEHPGRWIVGVPLVYVLLVALLDAHGVQPLAGWLEAPLRSLNRAVETPLRTAGASAGGSSFPDALLLWLAIAGAALALAASFRPEPGRG